MLASRAARFSSSPLRCSSAAVSAPRAVTAAAPSSGLFMGQRRAVTPFLLRTLTTAREKVKVLLVLYDGGQHAKDVS
jgi:formate dehydrogenase